jgi:cytidylate kinase
VTVITVGGLPGSGKSTFARLLAEDMGLRYLSAGQVFREMARERGMELREFSKHAEGDHDIDRRIEEMQVEKSRGGDVVVDSRLSAWVVENPDLRIYLSVGRPERARRVAQRDGIPMEQAINLVSEREMSERKRYKEIYDIDVTDIGVYDIIINSGTFLPDEILKIARTALDLVMKKER